MSFDKNYESEDWYYNFPPSEELEEYLSGKKAVNKRALDLGCGEGRDSILLASSGFTVDSVDLSRMGLDKLTKYASEKSLPIRTFHEDVRKFNIKPQTYDLISAVTILDHVERNDAKKLAAKIIKGLKPAGSVFIEVFTINDPAFTGSGPASETGFHVKTFFDLGELRGLFEELEVVYYEEKMEDDFSHGPYHEHGVAILIGKR